MVNLLRRVRQVVNTLERQFGIANQQFSEYAVERLSACVTNLTILKSVVSESTVGGDQVLESYEITLQELLDTLTLLHRRWLEHCEQTDALSYTARYSAPVLHTQQMGRPRFVVSKDQLEYLRSLSFTAWPEIATLLGVSRTTVYRRRQEYGMPTNDPSSVLRDQELEILLRDLRTELPYLGEALVMGRLRSLGYCISRQRLREAIRRTDPLNTPLRWGGSTPLCRVNKGSLSLGTDWALSIGW